MSAAADREEWLPADPDHALAAAVRTDLDSHRASWPRGHRDLLGFAYLTPGAGGG